MASPSCHTRNPLSLETSHLFPDVVRSPSLSFSPTPPSPLATTSSSSSAPSIYVTFKVLQLVKRIQKRVHSRASPKKVTPAKARQAFCQDFEQQAFEEIDKYLGRKAVYPPRRKARSKWQRPQSDVAVSTNPLNPSIEWLLNEIDQSVTSDNNKIDIVAKDHKLFLDRTIDFNVKRLSIKELTELIVTVKDLLATLKRTLPQSRVRTICEGNEVLDHNLDKTYIANLIHLLLCLQDQLIRLLIAKCITLVHRQLVESQKDQYKHCEDWFFEFPDSRHPLSTTWPWSIRPSLAVIWGVCWMFYNSGFFDAEGNMIDEQGTIIMLNSDVRDVMDRIPGNDLALGRHSHSLGISRGNPRSSSPPGNAEPQMMYSTAPPSYPALPPSNLSHIRGHEVPHAHPHQHSLASHQAEAQRRPSRLGLEATNNTSPAAPRPTYASGTIGATSPDTTWYPTVATQAETFQAQLGFHNDSTPTTPYHPADYSRSEAYWQQQYPSISAAQQQQQSELVYSHPALPPHNRDRTPLTPQIRVTTDFNNPSPFQQTPQDPSYSSAISSSSSQPLYEDQSYSVGNPYSAHLSPTHHMAGLPQVLPGQQSLLPHEGMQHPVSPISSHSPNNAQMGEPMSRKRSHSQMSQDGHLHSEHQTREPSIGAPQMGSASPQPDDYSPRGSRSFKRGDPPINANNKYICNFAAECEGQTFDRKCEWSKHMDKHDRPYRCPHRDCAKLQGFTYSGGLLRHEREVHGKHGGPKSQLMCPYEDCKRHSGKGFTRKENLNEHVRRVHDSKFSQQQTQNATGQQIPEFGQLADIPASRISDTAPMIDEMLGDVLGKRKHSEVGDYEEIKQEMKRLREDNEAKEERMRMMEAQEAHRVMELENLRKEIRALQQGQQGQQDLQVQQKFDE